MPSAWHCSESSIEAPAMHQSSAMQSFARHIDPTTSIIMACRRDQTEMLRFWPTSGSTFDISARVKAVRALGRAVLQGRSLSLCFCTSSAESIIIAMLHVVKIKLVFLQKAAEHNPAPLCMQHRPCLPGLSRMHVLGSSGHVQQSLHLPSAFWACAASHT